MEEWDPDTELRRIVEVGNALHATMDGAVSKLRKLDGDRYDERQEDSRKLVRAAGGHGKQVDVAFKAAAKLKKRGRDTASLRMIAAAADVLKSQ